MLLSNGEWTEIDVLSLVGPDLVAALNVHDPVLLRREPDNTPGANVITIIGPSGPLGRVTRTYARQLAQDIAAGKTIEARIAALFDGGPDQRDRGFTIEVRDRAWRAPSVGRPSDHIDIHTSGGLAGGFGAGFGGCFGVLAAICLIMFLLLKACQYGPPS